MLKKITITLLVVLVLLCLTIAALPTIVATSYFQNYVAKQLSTELERTVHLANPPTLKLGQPLNIGLSGISIAKSQQENDSQLLTLNALKADIDLLSLLMGEIKVDKLNLLGADLNLLEDKLIHVKALDANNITHGEMEIISGLEIDSQPVSVVLSLAPLKTMLSESKIKFKLKLKASENSLAGSGFLTLNKTPALFKIDAELQGQDASSLSKFTGVSTLPAEPYFLKINIEQKTKGQLLIVLHQLKLGENDIGADIQLTSTDSNHVISGNIKASKLTLPLSGLQATNEDEKSEPAEQENSSLSEVFAAIAKLTGKLEVEIQDFVYEKEKLKNIVGTLIVAKDLIDLPSLAMNAYGGKFTAKGALTPRSLKITAQGEDIHFDEINSDGLIEGEGTAKIDLSSKGETWEALLANINGSAEFLSSGGKLNNGSALIASSGIHEALPKLFGKETKAEVSCMIGRFKIANSVATFKDYILQIGAVSLLAKGEINFPESKISANFYTRSSLPALASLIPPFKVFGNLYDPTVLPNPLGVVTDVADGVQGLTQTVGGTIDSAASIARDVATGRRREVAYLSGVALCEKELELDKSMLTSQFGSMLDGDSEDDPEDDPEQELPKPPSN